MLRNTATPEQAARLGKVRDAGQHLLTILNDIIDLSKIEAGKVQLDAGNFALEDVLGHVASIMAEAIRAKGLQLTLDSDPMPPWLYGDAPRLRQAVLNYVSNAVKFTDSGRIDVRARLVRDQGDQVRIRIEVQDTGIGLTADQASQLFQAFEQGDASTTRRYGGTGLGLVITRRLIELMGGEVGVDSTAAVGSTFWFEVPLRRGHPPMTSAAVGEEVDVATQLRLRCGGSRLLLAEDNPVNREFALALLRRVELLVDTAEDGEQAFEKAQGAEYALVLMDLQMPRMGGLAACRALRELPGWADVPILAMTATAFDEDRRACRKAGMNDFIAKPVDAETLYSVLLRWLPHHAVQPAGPATCA